MEALEAPPASKPSPAPALPPTRQALAAERFALVILDVLLPDGDGIELLREIRDTPADREHRGHAAVDRGRGAAIASAACRPAPTNMSASPTSPRYVVARARELLRRTAGAVAPTPRDRPGHRRQRHLPRGAAGSARAASYRVLIAGSGEEGLRVAADAAADRDHRRWRPARHRRRLRSSAASGSTPRCAARRACC